MLLPFFIGEIMNKDYLNSLSKDQLENHIYDLNNELNQEWHLERIMKLRTCLLYTSPSPRD